MYHATTPEELSEAARKYLNRDNRVVVIMKPSKPPRKMRATTKAAGRRS
jgi:hypothetical protein